MAFLFYGIPGNNPHTLQCLLMLLVPGMWSLLGVPLVVALVALMLIRSFNNSKGAYTCSACCRYLWSSVVGKVVQFKIDNAAVV